MNEETKHKWIHSWNILTGIFGYIFFNENPSPGVNNFWMLIVGKVNSCQLFIQEKFELIFIHKCLSIEKYRYTYVIPPSMIELWPSESPPETFDSFLKIIQKFFIASSI